MRIFDVIKNNMSDGELVYKFPSDDIQIGSQLIVYPNQTAFFVKGGVILDEFKSGTHTIISENLPILGKLINLPYKNETPFKAEIWFVNQIAILDCKWGTAAPLQIEDPQYEVIVPIRAYGQYGFRIINPRVFLESLVGNMSSFYTSKVIDYFRGVIVSKLTSIIYNKLKADNLSVVNINAHVDELSISAKEKIEQVFLNYGLGIEPFNIISISVQDNDSSFQRLKAAKDAAAKIKIIGRADYQMTRSFDVLEKAAENEGDGAMNSAIGIGAGVGIGNVVGTIAAQMMKGNIVNTHEPPTIPQNSSLVYHIAINGESHGTYDSFTIENKIKDGEFGPEVLVWRKGMDSWQKLSENCDFSHLFDDNVPPPIPNQ